MRITLIGAGGVATQLGKALHAAGHTIMSVYSRTEEAAMTLGAMLDAPHTTQLEQLPTDSDVYISLIKDDALALLAPAMVRGRGNALWIHTSGSTPLSLWQRAGAQRYGALYPMQTFSKGKQIEWSGVPIFIEGCTAQATEEVRALARSTGSTDIRELDSRGRLRLHIAAVFACNFTNHMFTVCDSLLKESGLDFSIMRPLIEETVGKTRVLPPLQAQTGPAARKDLRIINRHLEMLAAHPGHAELYRIISQSIIETRENDKL